MLIAFGRPELTLVDFDSILNILRIMFLYFNVDLVKILLAHVSCEMFLCQIITSEWHVHVFYYKRKSMK